MNSQILNLSQEALTTSAMKGPKDEASLNLLADLADRENSLGQAFHLEKLDPLRHHVALCVGKTDQVAVFCLPPSSGMGAATYLWRPLAELVVCSGYLKWALGSLPVNLSAGPIVPPLEVGLQYILKQSRHSDNILVEDMFSVDRMRQEYLARFAGIKSRKPAPSEIDTPTLRPMSHNPKARKAEDIPTSSPGL